MGRNVPPSARRAPEGKTVPARPMSVSDGTLPREFYTRANVVTVARQLLGRLLVVSSRGARMSGIIVETEAYRGPQDRASHAYGGRRTNRTETMYRLGGTAYVYFVYGMYHQFNVVTNVDDVRALEPVEGLSRMRRRRPGTTDHDLTNGPGKLCVALGISRKLDGADLLGKRVWLEEGRGRIRPSEIATGPRIGIEYAGEWADRSWRFWIKDSPFVSRRAR